MAGFGQSGAATISVRGQEHSARKTGRGNGGRWKARKTKRRFSLSSHRPWKSQKGAISTFPPPRRRYCRFQLQTPRSEAGTPSRPSSIRDSFLADASKNRMPSLRTPVLTHTKQRGGLLTGSRQLRPVEIVIHTYPHMQPSEVDRQVIIGRVGQKCQLRLLMIRRRFAPNPCGYWRRRTAGQALSMGKRIRGRR